MPLAEREPSSGAAELATGGSTPREGGFEAAKWRTDEPKFVLAQIADEHLVLEVIANDASLASHEHDDGDEEAQHEHRPEQKRQAEDGREHRGDQIPSAVQTAGN